MPDNTVLTFPTGPSQLHRAAEHVAHNFALNITPALRSSHDDTFGPFQPATTATQLSAEYQATRDRAAAIPPGTRVAVPAMAVTINGDGHDLYIQLDKRPITDPAEQVNAILTELAEAVALDQAAAEARQRALGLMVLFEQADNR